MAANAEINVGINTKVATESVKTLDDNLQKVGTSAKTAKQELRELNNALQSGALQGKDLAAAEQRAAELRDTIADTNARVNILAGTTTEALAKGLQSVTQIGVMGFQGIMGAAAMFGIESENLQKTMVALQGAMAFSQAIEFFGGIGDKMDELSSIATKLGQSLGIVAVAQTEVAVATEAAAVAETEQAVAIEASTVAQTTSTVATEGATVATTALGTAMKALPILLIIAGITALGVAIYQTAQQANKGKLSNDEYKKVLDSTRGSLEQVFTKLDKVKIAFDQARSGTISKEKALQIYNNTLGTTFGRAKNVNEAEAIYNAKTEAYIQSTMLRAEANALLAVSAQKQAESITASQEDQTSWWDKLTSGAKGYTSYILGSTDGMVDAATDLAGAQAKGVEKIKEQNQAVIDGLQAKARDNLAKAEAIEKQAKLNIETDQSNLYSKENTKNTNDNSDAQDKLNKKLEERRKLLDEINGLIQRETDAANELRDLNIDREKIQVEGDATVFSLRNKHQQELAKVDIEFEKFKEGLIKRATEREVEALKERFINGTMTEQEYRADLEKITAAGADNLLQIESDLLSRKMDIREEEKNLIIENLEEINNENYMASQKLYLTLGQARVQFEKNMALKEIEFSNKSEYEKRKLRKETLEYYAATETSQIQQIADQDLEILYQKYQEESKLAKENGQSTSAIDAKYQLDKVNIEQDAANKIADIRFQLQDKTEQGFKATLAKVEESLTLYGEAALSIFNGINDLLKQQTENQIRDVNARYETEMHQLKALYDQKELSEEEFNAQTIALEQQRDQEERILRRKQFERDKKYNLASAIMSGAQAITNALATVPFVPAGLVAAATAAISTGIQIATINGQQFTAARGGIVPGNGPSNIDSVPSLLAPGEAVINANSAAMFPNTLSLINQAGGGVALAPELPQQGSSGSGTIFMENKQQPLKAYVVETEITDSQKRINRIQRSVEF